MKISDLNELQEEKSRLTGKQGVITSLMKKLKEIPPEERKRTGKTVNEYKISLKKLLTGVRANWRTRLKRKGSL